MAVEKFAPFFFVPAGVDAGKKRADGVGVCVPAPAGVVGFGGLAVFQVGHERTADLQMLREQVAGLSGRPADMPGKQAAAAVGQCELMYFYDKLFTEYNHIVAQLLLTGEDIRSEQRSHNVRNTLSRLLELGALPVINENDAVATDEIGVDNTIGENDSLSAIVAAAIGADLLILLSDIDGLYDSDPHRNPDARLIETVPVIDAHILSLAGDKGSALATGGMVTKLHAAQIATAAGCEMVIANGEKPEVLYDIVAGRRAGTRFLIPHS